MLLKMRPLGPNFFFLARLTTCLWGNRKGGIEKGRREEMGGEENGRHLFLPPLFLSLSLMREEGEAYEEEGE